MNDQLSKLAEDIFSSVTGYVARALDPIAKRLQDLEGREPAAGIDGAPGQKGLDGRDGKDGDPGRDAASIEPLPAIDPKRSYARGTWAKHAGGLWLARTLTDGMVGWDCIVNGVASLEVTSDGLRSVGVTSALSDGQTKSATFELPTMVYRGAWVAGTDYTPGDTSSWEGSMWHCEAPTSDRPGTSPAWRLAVKHGRDGKDGLRGAKGERGGEGRAGHDLTQMLPDGRRF